MMQAAATQSADCPYCAAAERDRAHHGVHNSHCKGCLARELAISPAAWRALHGHTGVDLQNAINRIWPGEYSVGREAVWRWVQLLGLNKLRA